MQVYGILFKEINKLERMWKNMNFEVKSADDIGHFSGLANGTEIVDFQSSFYKDTF